MTTREHVPEDMLEALAMGKLSSSESDRVEDHLLLCEKCQLLYSEAEEFAQLARACAASSKARGREATPQRDWPHRIVAAVRLHPFRATGGALALAALIVITASIREPVVYRDLALTTMRGVDPVNVSTAKSHLRLRLDLRELPPVPLFHVAVVDASGASVFDLQLPASQAKAGVEIAKSLSRGTYWVRLSEPGGQLLREYPLQIQ
jgi:hypothetical protein